jgi:hypothetical protein
MIWSLILLYSCHGEDLRSRLWSSETPVHYSPTIGAPDNCMTQSNSPSNPALSRATLKLKVGARKAARESKTAPVTQSSNSSKSKPGAHWSDEYKERMQADMDALLR